MRPIRLFFVTDLHGSELCFRKFISAVSIYNADVAIALGDLAGKMVVPVFDNGNGSYDCNFLAQDIHLNNKTELEEQLKKINAIGFYPYMTDRAEADRLRSDQDEVMKIFHRLINERLQHWVDLANEKLKDCKAPIFMAPGNDDPLEMDDILEESKVMKPCVMRNVDVLGYEMITVAHSSPTPWDTPREWPEPELAANIDKLAATIKNMPKAIFNFHDPPYGSMLDYAPKLRDMRQSAGETEHVGSKAVMDAIKKYQPFLGLHGHIHESRAAQWIGKTFCVNPGSEYGEGVLRGVLLTLSDTKMKSYVFTSG
ncbi:MAG: metallophosphoesterase [Candidatus Thermoplasmatota archaeon]|nr:metallophosphoesterase [Candidatus Thermoplasmatota archaeon]